MKVIETVYNVELNPQEIDTIITTLQAAYIETKESYESCKDSSDAPKIYNRLTDLKTLRDGFSSLTGRKFMGKDA